MTNENDPYRYINRAESGTVYGTGTTKSFNERVQENFKRISTYCEGLEARIRALETTIEEMKK